ncbi:MAG: ubiquitin-like domain-containing protein [Promethearchaeota archaeon]
MKVKVVSAIGGGEITVSIDESAPVRELKRIVAEQKRIPPQTVIVVFRGRQLDDFETLAEAGVVPLDKLYLITRTTGGM